MNLKELRSSIRRATAESGKLGARVVIVAKPYLMRKGETSFAGKNTQSMRDMFDMLPKKLFV